MSRLYWDCETDGLFPDVSKVWIICALDLDTLETFVYHDGHGLGNQNGTVSEGVAALNAASVLIGHNNIAFDNQVILKLYGVDLWRGFPGTIDDLLLSRWLKPRSGGHSMAAWGEELGVAKVENEDWSALTPLVITRCIGDVALGAKIHERLMGDFDHMDFSGSDVLRVEHLFAKEVCVAFTVGHPFDAPAARGLLAAITPRMDALEAKVLSQVRPTLVIKQVFSEKLKAYTWAKAFKADGSHAKNALAYWGEGIDNVVGDYCKVEFKALNLASSVQVKDQLLKLGWQPKEWNISKKTGDVTSPRLTEDSFSSLPAGLGELIAEHWQLKHRASLIEGLLKHVTDRGTLLHSINTLGTAAHRVTHRVLVNIPSSGAFLGKELRSLFTPFSDQVMVGTDLSGAHLHEVAVWMGDQAFLNALTQGDKDKGTDAHSLNAELMDVTRSQAKIVVYTYLNGGKAARIASQLGISKRKAERAVAGLPNAMPKLNPLIDAITRGWRKTGFIRMQGGAKLYPRKSNECLSYALLWTEQSIMKRGFTTAMEWARVEGLGVNFLSFNHDECQVSLDQSSEARWTQLIKAAIEEASDYAGINPLMGVETKSGGSWLDTH